MPRKSYTVTLWVFFAGVALCFILPELGGLLVLGSIGWFLVLTFRGARDLVQEAQNALPKPASPVPPAVAKPTPALICEELAAEPQGPGNPVLYNRGSAAWGWVKGVFFIFGGIVLCFIFLPVGILVILCGIWDIAKGHQLARISACPRCNAGIAVGTNTAITCPDCLTRFLVRGGRVMPLT